MKKHLVFKINVFIILLNINVYAQSKFEQLGPLLPTPNQYRTATGEAGKKYFQQFVDYKIDVKLNEKKKQISGKATIIYSNNSPHTLPYLWIQLDQNIRQPNSLSALSKTQSNTKNTINARDFKNKIAMDFESEYGYQIKSVTNHNGEEIPHIINETMMRIDLEQPLMPNDKFTFNIAWMYNVYNRLNTSGRGGYEYFPDSDDYVFTIAQWYPRMAVYDDYNGWQNKQFLGAGEFALEFGDFEVNITVPSDHIVAATGQILNAKDVLTEKQYNKFLSAKNAFKKPVIIVSEKEARKKEHQPSSSTWKTWKYKAKNVRDFAFASSEKFIWDGMAVKINDTNHMAYSFYPKEGNPLWSRESTKAVKTTLEYYSENTIPYPYPQATSVHAANQGMEYPMISFNYGRPNKKGKYSDRTRCDMISVIVHEIGHNFFPMIVNSDERQWTWMDEGINTFLETETIRYKYPDYDCDLDWSTPAGIAESGYLALPLSNSRPIMTNSENILQFGYNAYIKPGVALKVLKYGIMGPERFNDAFKIYAQRWAFKRPNPADFFRTMEDASGMDLDWFWKGWFYTVDHTDIDVSDLQYFKIRQESEIDNSLSTIPENDVISETPHLIELANIASTGLNEYRDQINVTDVKVDISKYHIYDVTFNNHGELVAPLILLWKYTDGTHETQHIPAEIWRYNHKEISKTFYKEKQVEQLIFDPTNLLGDTNIDNNAFPRNQPSHPFEK